MRARPAGWALRPAHSSAGWPGTGRGGGGQGGGATADGACDRLTRLQNGAMQWRARGKRAAKESPQAHTSPTHLHFVEEMLVAARHLGVHNSQEVVTHLQEATTATTFAPTLRWGPHGVLPRVTVPPRGPSSAQVPAAAADRTSPLKADAMSTAWVLPRGLMPSCLKTLLCVVYTCRREGSRQLHNALPHHSCGATSWPP
jgi:hypothetical protein